MIPASIMLRHCQTQVSRSNWTYPRWPTGYVKLQVHRHSHICHVSHVSHASHVSGVSHITCVRCMTCMMHDVYHAPLTCHTWRLSSSFHTHKNACVCVCDRWWSLKTLTPKHRRIGLSYPRRVKASLSCARPERSMPVFWDI